MLEYRQSSVVEEAHRDGGWCIIPVDGGEGEISLVSGGMDGSIKGWRSGSGELKEGFRVDGHSLGVVSLARSRDSARLATMSLDGYLKLWKWEDSEMVEEGKVDANVAEAWGLCFNPDGTHIASGSHSFRVNIWSCGEELTRESSLKSERGSMVMNVAYSPDGRLIAAGSSDGSIQLFDVESGSVSTKLPGHALTVRSLKFSTTEPDILITSADDQMINIYDTRNSQLTANLQGHNGFVFSVDLHVDNVRIASASADKTVKVRHANPQPIHAIFERPCWKKLLLHGERREAIDICLREEQDGRSTFDRKLNVACLFLVSKKVWDRRRKECDYTSKAHDDLVWGACFFDNGSKLASISDDKKISVIDCATTA